MLRVWYWEHNSSRQAKHQIKSLQYEEPLNTWLKPISHCIAAIPIVIYYYHLSHCMRLCQQNSTASCVISSVIHVRLYNVDPLTIYKLVQISSLHIQKLSSTCVIIDVIMFFLLFPIQYSILL